MTLNRSALGKAIAVTTLGCAALFLSACSLGSPGTAAPPGQHGASATPVGKDVTGVNAASGGTATPGASSAASSPGGSGAQAAAIASCPESSLTGWFGFPTDGTAGSTYYELEISNISSTPCTLYGFPGVSAVSGSTQLGSPAARAGSPGPVVTLGSYATAHVILRIVDVGALPGCQITTTDTLRVYAPGDYDSLLVPAPMPFQACANTGPVYLSVSATLPGAGIPGYSH
jgi:Protein of unknown function (DUF4232)